MITKAFQDSYKGHPTFSVWEVNEQGDKVGDYPLISMGGKKAVALGKHLEELKQFADKAEQHAEKKSK